MARFLRDLQIDRLSFWLGFLAASLFWWLILRLRPTFKRLFLTTRERVATAREGLTATADVRLRNDVIRYAEGLHLAAPLFSLDEILIRPSIVAPPVPVEPGASFPSQDIAEVCIPYMPDWPEMAALYGAPSLSLPRALENGANLILMGQPGSGKTVALAQLAIQIARREPLPGGLEGLMPLFFHAADLLPDLDEESTTIDYILKPLSQYTSNLTQSRLEKYLPDALRAGKVLLLVDGVDELPPMQVTVVTDKLAQIFEAYPTIRMVVAASCQHFDGLLSLGLQPVALADWNQGQRTKFINRWSRLWIKHVRSQSDVEDGPDPDLLNAWLLHENIPWSPLELTLKIWALYAGDLLGPSGADAIEAYLRRTYFNPEKKEPIPNARPSLERLAAQMVLSNNPFLERKHVGAKPEDIHTETPAEEEQPELVQTDLSAHFEILQEKVPVSRLVDFLVESGLLCPHLDTRIGFIHPVITGYLAGCSLDPTTPIAELVAQSGWDGQVAWDTLKLTLEFAASQDSSQLVEGYLALSKPPLHTALLNTGRWLRNAPAKATWRTNVLRSLASLLQNEELSISLRARVVTAMATSNSQGINLVINKMASSQYAIQRQLAALGAGLLADEQSVDMLANLLDDPIPSVRASGCLGLVAIDNRHSLEVVAEALLHGDEDLRRFAAEAFANHRIEGHPTLSEGSTLDDLLVRRAVVFGLKRVNQPWVIEVLEKMQVEDPQWVVKNMAVQALEELSQPSPHIPRPLLPLSETPWLIAFAGESGEGIIAGSIATDYLYRALREGNEEQKLAAIEIVQKSGDTRAIPDLYNFLYNEEGELSEAAFNALWHLAATGIRIPDPEEFAIELA